MHRSPASEGATAYLTALVSRMRGQGDSRLPSYGDLARRAGVSTVTVWKCLRGLAASGVLRNDSRRWLIASAPAQVGTSAREESSNRAGAVWQRVARSIAADIDRGAFAAGLRVPGCKHLCERYGAATATVRKAVRRLAESGMVQEYGRWYRVSRQSGAASGSTVFLVAYGRGQLEMGTPRTRDNLRAVESRCARHGLRLRVVPLARELSASQTERLAGTVRQWKSAVGAMLWDVGLNGDTIAAAADTLAREGLPVALLSEGDTIPAALRNRRAIQPFASGMSLADGAAVGRFLIARRHRRVAYLSPYGGALYSQRRRDGLAGAFEEAGLFRAVAVFEEQRAVDSASLSTIARREIQNIYEHYGALEYSAFREMMRRRLDAPQLQGLFERAIADPTVTAWVCNNDTVAVEALRFLRSRNIAVPQSVAIVGFDDSLEAFVEGLSSYSFDPSGLAQAMLNFLLMHSRRGAASARPPVTLPGYVNERQTT